MLLNSEYFVIFFVALFRLRTDFKSCIHVYVGTYLFLALEGGIQQSRKNVDKKNKNRSCCKRNTSDEIEFEKLTAKCHNTHVRNDVEKAY